jgi:hypothetical protein
MHHRVLFAPLAVLCLLVFCSVPLANAQCVEGTITSEMQMFGPFAGLYKYTVEVEWTTPFGLSHLTLDCGFSMCPEAACSRIWVFEEEAGTGVGGEPDGCEFGFRGEFNCNGDPSIGVTDPVVKWDAEDNGCEGGKTGSAVLCFFTDIAPIQGDVPVSLIKDGQDVCEGSLSGDCPMACPVPVESTGWGRLKLLLGRER